MQFNVHTAKSQLSKLIEAALAGEEVIIAKGNRPVVRLVPMAQSGFQLGVLQNVGSGPDFLEPLDDSALEAWESGA
ncbi:type II toxin-antitoxin system Phd/YefM family antitoxin [Tateyamaria omphalii]|uniref:Antitoxin n=1 Tax=Tateyamaria omphalii TaxID=299262 RepID=A0A1P8N1X4_9RHOB|nr:type II toxin-antitoxin system prevent-host-death family antitoxin [Tateyamaria omphalii]APX14310.1 prevent-host-death protein [Tateyamaria omphalii]